MQYKEYVVKKNETLNSIASNLSISKDELVRMNDLNVIEGSVLKVPNNESLAFDFYEIKQGDTITSLANKYGIDPIILLAINGLDPQDYLYPGQYILVPKEGVVLYITRPGDSLQSVSKAYNTNPEDVIVYNNNIYLLPDQIIAYKPI